LEAAMPNIVLQVKEDVKATLREVDAPELSPELETLLEGQIADLIDTKHKIRYLISKYIKISLTINLTTINAFDFE